jgi:hypothetical protein
LEVIKGLTTKLHTEGDGNFPPPPSSSFLLICFNITAEKSEQLRQLEQENSRLAQGLQASKSLEDKSHEENKRMFFLCNNSLYELNVLLVKDESIKQLKQKKQELSGEVQALEAQVANSDSIFSHSSSTPLSLILQCRVEIIQIPRRKLCKTFSRASLPLRKVSCFMLTIKNLHWHITFVDVTRREVAIARGQRKTSRGDKEASGQGGDPSKPGRNSTGSLECYRCFVQRN